MVIIRKKLAAHLADAVDGIGTHNGVLRGVVVRGILTERTYRAGSEYRTTEPTGHLETVGKRTHVYTPCQRGVFLTGSRQKRHEVEDGVDLILMHQRCKCSAFKNVERLERTVVAYLVAFTYVGSNDVIVAVNGAEMCGEFGTDLSACTYDQYVFHR